MEVVVVVHLIDIVMATVRAHHKVNVMMAVVDVDKDDEKNETNGKVELKQSKASWDSRNRFSIDDANTSWGASQKQKQCQVGNWQVREEIYPLKIICLPCYIAVNSRRHSPLFYS